MTAQTEQTALATQSDTQLDKPKQSPTEFKETLKFNAWAKHYLNAKDKESFGNATESAMRVYNCKNRAVASVIGTENIRKLSDRLPMVGERLGFTLPEMLKKLVDSAKTFDEVERLMARLGFITQVEETAIGNSKQQPGQTFNFNFQNLSQVIAAQRKERGL